MDFIQRFFFYMSYASLLCLLLGLFKPWMMVWWEDTQNRKKVIRIYGTAGVISYALYRATLII